MQWMAREFRSRRLARIMAQRRSVLFISTGLNIALTIPSRHASSQACCRVRGPGPCGDSRVPHRVPSGIDAAARLDGVDRHARHRESEAAAREEPIGAVSV